MTTSLAPNAITKTREYWATLGIEVDEEQAKEIARAYLELIDLITIKEEQKKGGDYEEA